MASLLNMSIFVALALLSSLFIQGAHGEIICEKLNKEDCAFAVSSTGKRCVLEKYLRRSGIEAYKCTTSCIEADKLKDMVETNHCIEACGLDRDTLGISSDSLLESRFTQKLCSPQCYKKCPNVIDLYFNLAAGEGVYLPKLCDTQGKNPRRGMSEIKSSGIAAPGPISGENFLGAPVGSIFTDVGAPVESPISSIELSDAPAAESPTDYPFYPPIVSPVPSIEFLDAPGAESPTDYPFYPPIVSPVPSTDFSDAPAAESPTDYPFYPPVTSPPAPSTDAPAASPTDYPFFPPIASPISSTDEFSNAPIESPTTYPPIESPTESPASIAPALSPYF